MSFCSKNLQLVQGDSLNVSFTLKNADGSIIDPTLIQSIYFTCKSLNINSSLSEPTELRPTWLLNIASTETDEYTPGTYSYDLTIIYQNSRVSTIIYEAPLTVLPKINTIDEV